MSGAARFLDDVARALAEPMPRRRVLGLAGAAVASLAVPGLRPGAALASPRRRSSGECGTGDVRACPRFVSGGSGPDLCCGSPARRWGCGGTLSEPVCVDLCPPPHTPCPTGNRDANGFAELACCRQPQAIGCCKGECIPNCELLFGKGHTPCCAECCNPGQRCVGGKCVSPCPPGRQRCAGKCCKRGESCTNGKCCPGPRACGDRCCPSGTKCAFSGRSRTCCPSERIVTRTIAGRSTRFCCPSGTRSAFGSENGRAMYACCPPNDLDCCEDDDLAPLVPSDPGEDDLAPLPTYVGRTFCVRGRARRL